MKLSEFEKLSFQDLDKLDTSSLRKLVSQQAGTLNRRVTNIRYNPDTSKLSIKDVDNSGGRFTTMSHTRVSSHNKPLPMNRKELIYEAKREIRFARGKASTVKKAKEYKEEQQKAGTGTTAREYARKKAKEARRKVREEIKRKPTGYTARQKARMKKVYHDTYIQAKKYFDKQVSNYWDIFEKWKEQHPEIGSPPEVAQYVEEWMPLTEEQLMEKFNNLGTVYGGNDYEADPFSMEIFDNGIKLQ